MTKRLLVHVEGQTEETFINNLLCYHLMSCGYTSVSARILGNARLRSNRGGIKGWPESRNDIVRHLRESSDHVVTTMVDFYALPQNGSGAWPGRAAAKTLSGNNKAIQIENEIAQDVANCMGSNFDRSRFIPYVVLHEFEGLLFSDCTKFANALGQPNLATAFQTIRNDFTTPEEINDSPITAPSKRLQNLLPGYDKVFFGYIAADAIGVARIRTECPHFNDWIDRLERAAA